MFEKFTSEGAADFRQRYEGTFGFYRDEKGKRLLTKLSYIRENVCVFVDSRGIEYKLFPNAEKDIGFEFLPPKASYYNTVDGAVLVQRGAARQFQRGISSKNTNISTLTDRLRAVRVDFAMLEKIYQQSISPREAFQKWDTSPSVAISKQIACSKGGVLYMYENHIGTYIKQGNLLIVKLDEPSLWNTEVQDACRNIGCNVEVT